MHNRILYTLTHIASQYCYKWLPPPELGTDAPLGCDALPCDLEMFSATDWQDILQLERAFVPARLPWLDRFLEYAGDGGAALCQAAQRHFAQLRAAGGSYVSYLDVDFPEPLRQIPGPPLGISLLGTRRLLRLPAVAVVGSRKASGLAVRESFELGRLLATAGYLVVSGGAFGCDIAAHHGVLTTGLSPAPAACVFAGGLAEIYPLGNAAVFRRLAAQGGLFVSERLWHACSRARDFPVRNRLIAGLAGVVSVMQAAAKSGAGVTARLALEQGRDVAVLYHPPDDARALGSSGLIADGAAGFTSAEVLMEQLRSARP